MLSLGQALTPIHAAKVTFRYLVPPSDTLPGAQRIAIMDLQGPYGTVVADGMISTTLQATERLKGLDWADEAEPVFFEIIERSRLYQVIQEQQLASSGLVDDSGAARIGEILGVDAIFLGTTRELTDDTHEDREVTYYKDDKAYTKIVRYYTRRAEISGKVRVVEATTGKVINSFKRTTTESKTDTEYQNLPSHEILLSGCAERLGPSLVRGLLPGFQSATVKLQKDKSVKDVNKVAASGRFEDGWQEYRAALTNDEYNHKIMYNIGVMHEAIGDLDTAYDLYRGASQINSKEKLYGEAVSRAERGLALRARLHELGFVLAAAQFSEEAAAQAREIAATPLVRVKAKFANLYETPNHNGTVLTRLPKNMELEILTQEGAGKSGYYRVQTFDGKSGWIAAKDATEI